MPMPSWRKSWRYPPNTSAANEIASTTSTAPITTPEVSAITPVDVRRSVVTGPLPAAPPDSTAPVRTLPPVASARHPDSSGGLLHPSGSTVVDSPANRLHGAHATPGWISVRVIDGDELRRGLSMTTAIDALDAAFRAEDPALATPLRTSLATPAGTLLTMPAAGAAGVGVKLVTLSEYNPQRGLPFIHAAYVLFDAETQRPEALLDGTVLTAIRTAAVSGLATRNLANHDASRLAIFGAGVQASVHLEAMLAVRPIRRLTVVSRSADRAAALVARAVEAGVDARAGVPGDVRE